MLSKQIEIEIESAYSKGCEYFNSNAYYDALKEFDKIGDEGIEYRGNCYYQLGRISDAINEWSKIYFSNDAILLKYIKCLIQLKQQEMLNKIKKQLSKNKRRPDIINYITALDKWKNYNKKFEALHLLKDIKFQDAVDQRGILESEINQIKTLIIQLESKVQKSNCIYEDKSMLVKLYYELRDRENDYIEKAIKILENIDNKGSCDHKYLGLCNKELSDLDTEEGRKNWADALLKEKNISIDPDLFYLIALHYFEKGDSEESETNSILNIDCLKKKYPQSYLLKGDLLMKQKNWTSALKSYANYSLSTGIVNVVLNKKKAYCIERIKIDNDMEKKGLLNKTSNLFTEHDLNYKTDEYAQLLKTKLQNIHNAHLVRYINIKMNKVSMDNYSGVSLYKILHEKDTIISFNSMIQILKDILSGLKELEARKHYHPNLNPHCIFVDLSGEGPQTIIIDYLIENTSNEILNWINPNEINDKQRHIYPLKLILWELFTRKIPYEDIIKHSQYKTQKKILNRIKNCCPLKLPNHYSPELQVILLIDDNCLTLNIISDLLDKAVENNDENKRIYLMKNEFELNKEVLINECNKSNEANINSLNILKRNSCITIGKWDMWTIECLSDVDCNLFSFVLSPLFVPTYEIKINMIAQIISGIIDIQKMNWHIDAIDPKYIAVKKPMNSNNNIILKMGNYGITPEYIDAIKKNNEKLGCNLQSSLINVCILICCHSADLIQELPKNDKEFIRNNNSYFPKIIKEIIENLRNSNIDLNSVLTQLNKELNK